MADATYNPGGTGIYRAQGGMELVIGSSARITIPVTSGTTSTNLPNFGAVTVTASSGGGAQGFTLDTPVAGTHLRLSCTLANSTDTVTITAASTNTSFSVGSANKYKFILPGDVDLVGISTGRWSVTSISTAIAFPTS